MSTKIIAGFASAAFLGIALCGPAAAQSLDIRNAAPVAPGENHGTVDSMVGPQYWLINCHKGSVHISLRFNSMGLFGNPTTASIQEVLHQGNGKQIGARTVTSPGQMVENDWPGSCATRSTMIVELRPPGNSLVRTGGDYSLTVDGSGVDYASGGGDSGGGSSGPDRVVGTYAVMVCAPDWDCQSSLSIHFAPDGTVRLTDGHTGTWSVFDPDAHIYTVVVGGDRLSLKLVPGRGMFGTNDLSVPVFQAVRPN
jgi:hypothetical protein